MLKVVKFGGSSLSDANQFKKVKDIILSDPLRRVVVVSAIGKKNKEDNKVTDLLFLLSSHIKYHVDGSHILDEVFTRYLDIKNRLSIDVDLEKEFDNIKVNIKKGATEAYIVSRGEYLSALLLSKYIGYKFVDAYDLFMFDYNGKINLDKTDKLIKESINELDKVVVPGFYGKNKGGAYHLFSRGGSDVSASIIARSLNAKEYENFTDVSGILKADPKIIDNPAKIKAINYDELRELSYMGANVLHEETLLPIEELDVPIHIMNTNAPEEEGTYILKDVKESSSIVTGITGKKNYLSITIKKKRQSSKNDIVINTLNILNKYNVSFEHLPSSIDSFSLIIENKDLDDKIYEIIGDIKALPDCEKIELDKDLALVAVIGRSMAQTPGISGKIFGVLGKANINIKTIAQGSEELTIIIGISNQDFENTIKELYKNF